MTDFTVRDEGSLFLLTADARGAGHGRTSIPAADAQTFGGAIVEHRYIEPIVLGIIADGLQRQPRRLT
jgi:hypothetical protein